MLACVFPAEAAVCQTWSMCESGNFFFPVTPINTQCLFHICFGKSQKKNILTSFMLDTKIACFEISLTTKFYF